MTNLVAALKERFSGTEGLEEANDVARHGCSGGVSGFIYTTELNEFFNEHESDIEDHLHELDLELSHLVKDQSDWTFQEVMQNSVWICVESFCQNLVESQDVL